MLLWLNLKLQHSLSVVNYSSVSVPATIRGFKTILSRVGVMRDE
jgi:hypothetical protein